jgi:hypothetical protein
MNLLVYQNKQFNSRKDLIDAILEAASNIDKNAIKGLYEKFPNRLIKLIETKAKRIDY